ncbi:redoxin domain-containing protein [Symbiobacterium thermophilum]|uniref:Cytochrome C biogenesis protein n=1 Tax=Symbiobacterium thermophilum (strain DSM 24528 / JCM 14929 / IAM 14863 / T) TaxID=292459 RepID=Q67NM5_SYMTH|nr:redoxin domain-containing protein [Symbiobacterium thermophilum]BAD40718.1 cytochrome C biogenesis protein [Symbiobacterium thermophilum IAM 14863]
MFCPECRTSLQPDARYCHLCGWDSKAAAAARRAAELGRRPAWKRWVSGVSLGIMAFVVLFMLLVPRTDAYAVPQVGSPAPDFEIPALDGGSVRLSDLRGQPVIINFWATWCPPCRKEMPDFQEVYDRYKGDGLQFYAINVGESRVTVRDFMARIGVDLPVLIDAGEEAQSAYNILPIPATFFIDREGIVRAVYQYQMSRAQIEFEVQRLMAR